MKDFVRIIPKKGFEEWPAKLNKMSRLFHTAEYQMVKKGKRNAATIHIDQNNMQEIMDRINKEDLKFTPLRKSGYYQGFSHFHKQVETGEPFYWYGCLTRDQKDAEIFKTADLKGDHKTIGKMLGFPECCGNYFARTFPAVNYDPIWVDKQNEVSGFAECNQMLRYFGARITSHLSCSPECKGTKKIGEEWIRVMKEEDSRLTKELYDLLSGEIIWNSYHGVVQVDTPYFVGLTHTFPYPEKPRIIHWHGKASNFTKKLKNKKSKSKNNQATN